jgi:hypothetical protein
MALASDEREALRMLADSPHGSTESILLAHAERRTVRSGRRLIEVKWMTITDAGRQALAE